MLMRLSTGQRGGTHGPYANLSAPVSKVCGVAGRAAAAVECRKCPGADRARRGIWRCLGPVLGTAPPPPSCGRDGRAGHVTEGPAGGACNVFQFSRTTRTAVETMPCHRPLARATVALAWHFVLSS
ncbi:hypothetical protein J6590_027625 [Homalodisca vitripennis]|nr:hypothetical protein J6590_027625 [Homalodisca vitripennis]